MKRITFGLLLLPSLFTAQLQGIDVSKFQGDVNWDMVAKDSVDFAIMKASQGTGIIDKKLEANWKGADKLKMKSAYHFYVTIRGGKEQARYFMKAVGVKKWTEDIPPVVDVERIDGDVPTKEWIAELKKFNAHIEKKWKVKPMIYSGEFFYEKYLAKEFKENPLWIARYRKAGPELKYWGIWQYSDKGNNDGVSVKNQLDLNVMDTVRFNEAIAPRHASTIKGKAKKVLQGFVDYVVVDDYRAYRDGNTYVIEFYNPVLLDRITHGYKTAKKMSKEIYPLLKEKGIEQMKVNMITMQGGIRTEEYPFIALVKDL